MARKRMIDPSFWTDEKLGSLTPLGRLLFMGLISNADDEGRLPGHPALVKSEIFPYDIDITIKNVEDWMKQLDKLSIILVYKVDAQTYIQIKNFSKYQTINRPTPSRYPGPCSDNSLNTHGVFSEDSLPKEEKRKEDNRIENNINASADADSVSNTPAEKPSDNEEDGGAQNVEAKNKKAGSSGKGEEYTQEFETFWSYYPRRHEKKAAFRCWNQRLKEKVNPEDLINASKNYKEYCTKCNTEEQFIKLPKTFLGRDKPYEEYIKGCPEVKQNSPATNANGAMKKQLDAYKFSQRQYTEEELDSLFDDIDDV